MTKLKKKKKKKPSKTRLLIKRRNKRKKEKRSKTPLTMSNSTAARGWCSPFMFFLIFSPIWEENILVSLERKYFGLAGFFPSSPFNQTLTKNVSSPIFSQFFFSIFPKIHPTKHTIKISFLGRTDPIIKVGSN